MAPEMYEERYSIPVDIYAFGMCLLEIVSQGKCPYQECGTPGAVYRKVINGETPDLVRKIKDVQPRMIVNECLDKDPIMRPTAENLLLSEWLKDNEVDRNVLCELEDDDKDEKVTFMEVTPRMRQKAAAPVPAAAAASAPAEAAASAPSQEESSWPAEAAASTPAPAAASAPSEEVRGSKVTETPCRGGTSMNWSKRMAASPDAVD